MIVKVSTTEIMREATNQELKDELKRRKEKNIRVELPKWAKGKKGAFTK